MGALEASTIVIKMVFTGLVVGVLLWFVARPMFRIWREQPDPEALMPKFADLPEEELQIPTDPADRPKAGREEMIKQARSDPHQTALILKQWIAEKKNERKKERARKA